MPLTCFAGLGIGSGIFQSWPGEVETPGKTETTRDCLCVCLQEINCAYVHKGDLEANVHSLVEEINFLKTMYEEVSTIREDISHPSSLS